MRISAKAEYACVAMLALAAGYRASQPLTVKAIAEEHGIPPRFLVQILLQLKGSSLVISTRGALGGYQLARPPERISLADIIGVIDPPSPVRTEAVAESPELRVIRAVWKDIQAEEQHLLKQCTLAELVRRTQEAALPSYQI